MKIFAAVKNLAGEGEVFEKEVGRRHRIIFSNLQYYFAQGGYSFPILKVRGFVADLTNLLLKEVKIMKKLFMVFSLVVALIGFMPFNAVADQITGAISFSGTALPSDPDLSIATAFTAFSNTVVSSTGGTGDYASVLSNQPVTFSPFQFAPVLSPNPVSPLWTFANGGIIYSFDATGIIVNRLADRLSHTITMYGPGIAKISGFDDTFGDWYFSANTAGSTASFSASAIAVPEPATLMLLGLGLLGIGTSTRIRIKR